MATGVCQFLDFVLGGVDAVKARLAEGLPLYWEKMPEAQFEKLWKSISDRTQAAIKAKG